MIKFSLLFICLVTLFFLGFFNLPQHWFVDNYELQTAAVAKMVAAPVVTTPKEPEVAHIKTPEPLKAIYMTSWVAGTRSIREKLVKIIDETEINALVIDIKDYTGQNALTDGRMPDIKEFIESLHEKNVYVIGRIAVFQDPLFVKERPDLAVKRASDGEVWKDRKGISWLDAAAKEAWERAADLARESYALGFDEINFDYIRFPSDGNMEDIAYPFYDKTTTTKPEVLRQFFAYLDKELSDIPLPISADLFGLTTSAKDDLGIGQILEDAAPYFDYIAPMVYPSHFAAGFEGLKNPAANPYEVIKYSMDEAVKKLNPPDPLPAASATATSSQATTTLQVKPKPKYNPLKLRPWLQDFDLGADYTADMVRAQIQATYDAGLTSWMLWDPSNKYTKEALEPAL